MVDTEPNPLIATVTDQFPTILLLEQWGLWLRETYAPLPEVKAVLVPHAGGRQVRTRPRR